MNATCQSLRLPKMQHCSKFRCRDTRYPAHKK